MHRGINNKKVSLILSLLSLASNLMVNKNTVSQVTELLIRRQFKNSPLQFFTVFPSAAAAPIVDLFISVFVFALRLAVVVLFFFPSSFWRLNVLGGFGWGWRAGGAGRVAPGWGRGACFSPLFTFHISRKSALSFPPCDTAVRRFRNSCQLQIKTGWSGCNIELLNTAES